MRAIRVPVAGAAVGDVSVHADEGWVAGAVRDLLALEAFRADVFAGLGADLAVRPVDAPPAEAVVAALAGSSELTWRRLASVLDVQGGFTAVALEHVWQGA